YLLSSANFRGAGWSSSGLVLERNPKERGSKVTVPSGLGWAMGVLCAAGLSAAQSGLPWPSVPNSEKPAVLVHISKPPRAMPRKVPKRDHSGLALRTFHRSAPIAEERQAAS